MVLVVEVAVAVFVVLVVVVVIMATALTNIQIIWPILRTVPSRLQAQQGERLHNA